MNSLSVSRIHYEFTLYFANITINSLSIRELDINSRFISRIHYEFNIYFANLRWIKS